MRILLVEDDWLLGEGLQTGLEQQGFQVDWLKDGQAAAQAWPLSVYAAAVLDIALPGQDGLAVLRGWRQAGEKLPVLLLTARDALGDRVQGLDRGADDYVVKPVDLLELAARLRALVRRAHGIAEEQLRTGDVVLNPSARTITQGGRAVALAAREFDLLHTLMRNAGRVLSREQLEQQLYAWGREVDSNAVEVHVHHLRRKLGGQLIHTVRGVGYVVMKPTAGP